MDIALFIDDYGEADIDFDGDVVIDDGLETAVYISLFTDCKLDKNRGWWGDYFSDKPLGSKLWTLERENASEEVMDSFKVYIGEALQWMVDDGIAESIDVNVSLDDFGNLLLDISIARPQGVNEKYKYYYNWKSQELKRG